MNTMQTVVLVAHTFIAIMIIVLVLLQRGKGADAGAAFGSGASGTVFGARGSANFFSRATAVLATAFFASSLALAYLSSQEADRPESLIEGAPAVEPEESPAEPGEPAGNDGTPPDLPAMQDDAAGAQTEPAAEPGASGNPGATSDSADPANPPDDAADPDEGGAGSGDDGNEPGTN